MNNLKDFADFLLANKKESIITELDFIAKEIDGYACYDPSLRPGKSSSFLIYALQDYFNSQNKKFNSYLEIGTLFGGSLCALARSGFKGTAYGCDIYQGYYGNYNDPRFPTGVQKNPSGHMSVVEKNVKKMGNNDIELKLICGDSLCRSFVEGISQYRIKPLDVLYIDGLHTKKGCIADWELYSQFLKKGGLLLADNYEMKEIQQCVSDRLKTSVKNNVEGVWNNSTWIGVKK